MVLGACTCSCASVVRTTTPYGPNFSVCSPTHQDKGTHFDLFATYVLLYVVVGKSGLTRKNEHEALDVNYKIM